MRITFCCSGCGASLETHAEAVGAQVECPGCKATVAVPRTQFGTGTTIGGFRVTSLLGKGGMGEVWLATQLSLEREVALKVLPAHMGMQEDSVRRFLQEVRFLARLSHPNIVPAYEAGEDGGVLFFAMAYVRGESLETKLRREGNLAEAEALRIVEKVARALAYAWNQHQLLHRDIKPSNVLMDEAGEPMLVDLGLAKSLVAPSNLTQSSAVMGTPNYMSPEQAEGLSGVSYPADMYSLGLTLYHMLTGKVPFEGTTPMETLRKQLTEKLPDPREANPAISEACVELLQTMLAKKPSRRHKTWEDLLADIQRVRNSQSPTLRLTDSSESMVVRAGKGGSAKVAVRAVPRLQGKRSPLAIAVAVATVVAVLIGAAWWLRPHGDPPSPPRVAEKVPPASGGQSHAVPAPSSGLPPSASAPAAASDESRIKAALARLQATQRLDKPPVLERRGSAWSLTLKDNPGLRDLTPLAGLPIAELRIDSTGVTDLRPLAGMPLKTLSATNTPLVDLSPLRGITSLEKLSLAACPSLRDLSPLRDLKQLRDLGLCYDRGITDLTPLAGLNLRRLILTRTGVVDLSPVARQGIEMLAIGFLPQVDLRVLAGARFKELAIGGPVASLKPLKDVSVEGLVIQEEWGEIDGLNELPELLPMLKGLTFNSNRRHALNTCPDFVFRFPALEWVAWDSPNLANEDRVPIAEFRAKCKAAGNTRQPTVSATAPQPATEKPSPALPATSGDAVGTVVTSPEKPPALEVVSGGVSSGDGKFPAATLQKLKDALAKMQAARLLGRPPTYRVSGSGVSLTLDGTEALADLSPLEGLPIINLTITGSRIKDLRPLASLPLEFLSLTRLPIHDLTPISGISSLQCLGLVSSTSLKDLTPLHGMPQLAHLNLASCSGVHDLTPLAGLKLKSLNISTTAVRDLSVLRGMPLQLLVARLVNIKDISPAVSPFLETLSLDQNSELDLGTLAGAKLKELHLCRVKQDLARLKGVAVDELALENHLDKYLNLEQLPSILSGLRRIVITGQSVPPSECPEFVFRFPCLEGIAWTTIPTSTGEEVPQQAKVIPVEEFKAKWMAARKK